MIAGLPAVRFITALIAIGEFLGLLVFIVMYARRADWRASYAGRTLMWWPAALAGVMAASALVRFWTSPLMTWTLAVAHGVFLLAVWHRVRVLRRYLRNDETEAPDGQDAQGTGRGRGSRIGGRGDRATDGGPPDR